MSSTRRFLILAHGAFGPLTSKTANAAIRYIPEQIAVVLDETKAGSTAQTVLGFGGEIPVVATFEQAMAQKPNALLIGIAPAGGQFPAAWRALILDALRAGLDIWSGLHTMLGDDLEFAAVAKRHNASIIDLRRAPADLDVSYGRVREIGVTVVLTVGSDCNMGKMTTMLQIKDLVTARGPKASFAATGQTGILVEGRGIAVDAVIADFIAGAAERLTIEAAEGAEIVLVEGQGSIIHPAYSGVTLGLMHGSLPHAMLLCAQPSRTTVHRNPWVPIPPLTHLIRLYEELAAPLRPAKVVGVALNTFDLSEAEARDAIARTEDETGLPCTDAVRYDGGALADAIVGVHRARRQ